MNSSARLLGHLQGMKGWQRSQICRSQTERRGGTEECKSERPLTQLGLKSVGTKQQGGKVGHHSIMCARISLGWTQLAEPSEWGLTSFLLAISEKSICQYRLHFEAAPEHIILYNALISPDRMHRDADFPPLVA